MLRVLQILGGVILWIVGVFLLGFVMDTFGDFLGIRHKRRDEDK